MEYTRYQNFQPNYHNLVNAARNQWAERLPLYEHIIGQRSSRTLRETDPMT